MKESWSIFFNNQTDTRKPKANAPMSGVQTTGIFGITTFIPTQAMPSSQTVRNMSYRVRAAASKYRWFLGGTPRSAWDHTPSRRKWRPPRCRRSDARAAAWASPNTKPRGPEGGVRAATETVNTPLEAGRQHLSPQSIFNFQIRTYHVLVDEMSHEFWRGQALLLENTYRLILMQGYCW